MEYFILIISSILFTITVIRDEDTPGLFLINLLSFILMIICIFYILSK